MHLPEGTTSDVLSGLEEAIEQALTRTLRGCSLNPFLEEAVTYSTLGGGKRIRPTLVLLSCKAVGGTVEDAWEPAIAIELIHTFSLIHDDLPAMDDDEFRRGKPTLHRQMGEAMGILAGDVLGSLAFRVAAETAIPPDRVVAVIRELSTATTTMIEGQVLDCEGGYPDELNEEQRLLLLHRSKTGALIRGACRIGGWCGGAGDSQIASLSEYGEAIGLMFQMIDDLIDVTQTTENAGKSTDKDADAGKLTTPGLYGVDRTRHEISLLLDKAENALVPLGGAAADLRNLARDLAVRTR